MMWEICSKLTIKTPQCCYRVCSVIFNFAHFYDISNFNFKYVNADWIHWLHWYFARYFSFFQNITWQPQTNEVEEIRALRRHASKIQTFTAHAKASFNVSKRMKSPNLSALIKLLFIRMKQNLQCTNMIDCYLNFFSYLALLLSYFEFHSYRLCLPNPLLHNVPKGSDIL